MWRGIDIAAPAARIAEMKFFVFLTRLVSVLCVLAFADMVSAELPQLKLVNAYPNLKL